MLNSRLVRAYLLPGLAFQSVIVAGGYATGREVVEYITSYGALGGLLALVVAALTFTVILVLSYEFARTFKVYEYRAFFKVLLGKLWVCYEIVFVITLLLILAVVTATAANVFWDNFGIPKPIGVLLILAAVIFTNYFGREVVSKTLALCAIALTLFIFSVFVLSCLIHGGVLQEQLGAAEVKAGWALSGFIFAAYNCTTIPALLYTTTAIQSRKEAIGAGIITALLAMLPGLIFHLSFLTGYTQVLTQPLPSYWLIAQLPIPYLLEGYIIILFVTLVQSGVGLLQGLIERIDGRVEESRGRPLSAWWHAGIAAVTLLLAAAMSAFGVIDLIAKGYRGVAVGLFLVYLVPICTLGVAKLLNKQNRRSYDDATRTANNPR